MSQMPIDRVPFLRLLGLQQLPSEAGRSRLWLPELKDEFCNMLRAVHGGVLMTLLDVAMARAESAWRDSPYVMFVVPLLIESGSWRGRVDRILVVDCSPATQEARVCSRSRLDATLVRQIMSQQARRDERLDSADDILVNEGPLEQLAARVSRLHRGYCAGARGGGKRL